MTSALRIAESPEGYVAQLSNEVGSKAILINSTGDVSVTDVEKTSLLSSFATIAGIIGVIRLHANHYLITADGASECGTIYENKKLYKVATFSILPLSKKPSLDEDETKYLEILQAHLDSAQLYFSYNYDLTSSFSRQGKGSDEQFTWNQYVSTPLVDAAKTNGYIEHFILPLIYGYVKFVKTTINATPVTFGLITRRSRYRAGTRYFRRGINSDGYVANFNETEQFLVEHTEKGDAVRTYLQTRGSVPVYWAEMNDLKYKPELLLGPSDFVPTRQHFDRTIAKYGTNYLVNLVNQSGHEKPVKLAYENAVTALADPQLKYTYFDFHHECRKMRWDRAALLLSKLSNDGLKLTDYSSFSVALEQPVQQKQQQHTVRTNCMDCLDRTNVVQSMLGRSYLQQQLEDSGVVSKGQDWKVVDPAFNLVFMNIWADNADAVSLSYSGTGALKTDFTRTGKRTKAGALNDLWNSISRYFRNNFADGARQDGFDLFLGNALPFEISSAKLNDQRPAVVKAVSYGVFVATIVIITTIASPIGSLTELKNTSFLAVLFMIDLFCLRYIFTHGIQYVHWPKLCALDFLGTKEVLKNGTTQGIEFVKSDKFTKYAATDEASKME